MKRRDRQQLRSRPAFTIAWWFVPLITLVGFAPSVADAAVHVHGPTKLVAADQNASIGAGSSFANLHAARGEVESFQIVVDGPATNVSASVGAINGPAALAQARVRLYRAANYEVVTPSDNELNLANPCAAGCSLPNVLIPTRDIFYNEQRNAFPFDVAAGRNVTLWVDVSIPAGLLPGLYTGTVTVGGQGANAVVPWSVSVKPVTIPATSRLRGSFSATPGRLLDAYGGVAANVQGGAWQFWSRIVRLGLDNRLSTNLPSLLAPTAGNAVNFTTYAAPYLAGTGTTEFAGARIQDVLPNRYEAGSMGAWYARASSDGWLDRLTWYCDEVGFHNWATVCTDAEYGTALASWRSSAGAGAFMPTTLVGTPYDLKEGKDQGFAAANSVVRLVGLVTRMDVKLGWGDYPGQIHPGNQRPDWDAFLATPGNSAWLYTSCMTEGCGAVYEDGEPNSRFKGWPTYAIDQAEGEARAMPWQVYSYDLTGEYYYETLIAFTNPAVQYEDGANGDGALVYLGRAGAGAGVNIGGVNDIPLESWRLKQIRDGREDYELIRLLEDQAGRPVALAQVRALMPNLYSSNVTAAQYAQARASLFAALDADDPGAFHSVAPCRVLDSRETAGVWGGTPLAAGQERGLALGGACGIPPTAQSVVINVTVVGATADGHVRIFPAATLRPTTSVVNFRADETRANNAIVLLGSGGAVTLFSGQPAGTVNVIVDVTGYFE